MSAQHKMPGRSGKRARRERTLERLEGGLLALKSYYSEKGFSAHEDEEWYEATVCKMERTIEELKNALARPLRPIPKGHQDKPTR